MKPVAALAALEFEEVATGLFATDALLKKAPISFVKTGTITRGRYLTLFGGSTASVEESFREGVFHGGGALLDQVFLPDVHPRLFVALGGGRREPGPLALALLETPTVCAAILAAEVTLKGTGVDLLEIRIGDQGLGGKGIVLLSGELHEVEAAVEIAERRLGPGRLAWKILPRPHDALARAVGGGTSFGKADLVALPGERG